MENKMNEWVQLTSSNLARARWDNASNTLEIEFIGGRIYQYYDVPQQVFDSLCSGSDSAGKYFMSNIRGHFRYARL
jgi:hypothetical protein